MGDFYFLKLLLDSSNDLKESPRESLNIYMII